MKFKITKKTDPAIIDLFYAELQEQEKEQLHESVLKRYGISNFAQMKIGDFLDCCNGDFSAFFDMQKANSFDYIFVLAFREFIELFTKQIENLQVPAHLLSDEQKNISRKLPKLSFNENILIFMQKYFSLQNFESVAELKLFELILAKKAQYSSDLAESLSLYLQKSNAKSKK